MIFTRSVPTLNLRRAARFPLARVPSKDGRIIAFKRETLNLTKQRKGIATQC